MDDVLLEVCNRKAGCCDWSLIAVTSHIITLGSTPFQGWTHIGNVELLPSPYFMTQCYLCVSNFQPSTLSGACLSLTLIVWFARAFMRPFYPDNARVSSISIEYPTWGPFISKPCDYDVARDFVCPHVRSIQENVIFDRAQWSLQFKGSYTNVRCHPQ
jgi:hypothetical protein